MAHKILSNRRLLILGAAEAISSVGNWITMMAVFSLLVFRGNGGVATSSGIFLAGLLPMLVFSPLAGKLCDRRDPTWPMVGANILAGLAISFLTIVERLDLVYLCVALEAVFLSIITPARQALVPRITPSADLTHANALLQQMSSVVKIFGPMIGAAVVGLVGPHLAVILDVTSFAVAAGLLIILSRKVPYAVSENPERSDEQRSGEAISELTPWQSIRQNLPLRLLFVGGFMAVITVMGTDVLSSLYTRDVLEADEGFYGLSIGVLGFGSVLSGLYLLWRKGPSRPFLDLGAGLLLLALRVVALGWGGALGFDVARIVVVVASFIGGWGNGLILVQASTILQTNSPPAVLGRIAGLFQSDLVAGQLTALVLTPLIVPRLLSVESFFLVSGGALVLIALIVLYTAINYCKVPGVPIHDSTTTETI